LETPDSKSEEEVELFHVDPCHPERVLQISTKLFAREENQFKKFLSENLDVFAWSLTDMPGMDPSIFHKLSILPEVKPVKQNPHKMNDERLRALNDELTDSSRLASSERPFT